MSEETDRNVQEYPPFDAERLRADRKGQERYAPKTMFYYIWSRFAKLTSKQQARLINILEDPEHNPGIMIQIECIMELENHLSREIGQALAKDKILLEIEKLTSELEAL